MTGDEKIEIADVAVGYWLAHSRPRSVCASEKTVRTDLAGEVRAAILYALEFGQEDVLGG